MLQGGKNMEADEQYIKTLFPRLNDIKDGEIREKVASVWLDAWKDSKYGKIEDLSQWEPARDEINMSNVDHTNQVIECAIAAAGVVERMQKVPIDMDALIAAAILHDVDKILMFDPSSGEATAAGTYLPHTGLGGHLALKAGLPLKIVHAIAAHSPNFSSVSQKTPEAVIIANADHLVTSVWNTSRNIEISFDVKH
jgi:putative nucleotidyltransferase with HDIG domain